MPESWELPQYQPEEGEVAIDYVKAPNFAVHWSDGAVGSVTPSGYVHFALYAERQAMPRRYVFKLLEDGTLGAEVREKRIGRDAVVRELSCDVIMSADVAERLANWLLATAREARSSQGRQSAQEGKS